jgi:hypothetical protein
MPLKPLKSTSLPYLNNLALSCLVYNTTGLTVAKHAPGPGPNSTLSLSSGASFSFAQSLFSELDDHLCGSVVIQAVSWAVEKHACSAGEPCI